MSTLRELEAAATPAPWAVVPAVEYQVGKGWRTRQQQIEGGPHQAVLFRTAPATDELADSALIVGARNALPLLLDVVDAARRHPVMADHGYDCALCAAVRALDSEPLP